MTIEHTVIHEPIAAARAAGVSLGATAGTGSVALSPSHSETMPGSQRTGGGTIPSRLLTSSREATFSSSS